ncbi:MAG: DUF2125 domain-containing protein, partial [Aestuariivirgaceae bacterium]
MPPSTSRQKTFTMLLGTALVMAIALWSAYWVVARGSAEDRLAEVRETLRQSGTRIDCGTEHWGGFPFRIALTCMPLILTISAASSPVTIDFSRIDLLAQAYDLDHVIAVPASPVNVKLTGNALTFRYQKAAASFEESVAAGSRLIRIIAAADGLNADVPFLRDHPLAALSLKGALSTGPLVLVIDQLELRAQEIGVHGSGRVALDESHRLNGRLKLSVDRLDLLLADLGRAGLLSEKESAGASLLDLLGS